MVLQSPCKWLIATSNNVPFRDPVRQPSSAQIADASKVRRRLIDSFAQYDVAAKRIRDLPTNSPTQRRLQKAIYQQASSFLHLHMLPLKSLPKVLKHATPDGRLSNGTNSPRPSFSSGQGTAASVARPHDPSLQAKAHNRTATVVSIGSVNSENSIAISALEEKEKSLRDRLVVLEEQKFFVSEMIADANRRRKFDEVSSLAMNIEDLSHEIDIVNKMLGNLDFEGVYTGQHQQ